jgi:hypothetical protein
MGKLIQRAIFLAVAGFVSALFTTSTGRLAKELLGLYPGIVFGVAVAAVFVVYDGVRSPSRLLSFFALSTAAYPISVWSGMATMVLFKGFGLASVGRQLVPIPSFFIGGSVGALIIFLGALVVLKRKMSARPFYWALIGGVLGLTGCVVSAARQSALHVQDGDAVHNLALAAIWQTGVALCIVFVVPRKNE